MQHPPKTLEVIQNKILNKDTLIHFLNVCRFFTKKIVFTNGVFDILHRGHIEYLCKARDEGNVLLVGMNTDNSTRKLKGPLRPINHEDSRSLVLASLHCVTAVMLFDEDTPYELIKIVQPDILVKGSDYNEKDIVGADIVKAKNGIVKTIDFVHGYSTSAIEKEILSKGK